MPSYLVDYYSFIKVIKVSIYTLPWLNLRNEVKFEKKKTCPQKLYTFNYIYVKEPS